MIPEIIETDGPYFYFWARPCRAPESGEIWNGPHVAPKLFIGAAIRHGMCPDDRVPTVEVIARCDKSRIRALTYGPRPWIKIRIADFRVPPPANPKQHWTGSPDVNHTFALLEIAANRGGMTDYRLRLQLERGVIEKTEAALERFTREGNERWIRHYQYALAEQKEREADLVQRITMEAALRMADDSCDVW